MSSIDQRLEKLTALRNAERSAVAETENEDTFVQYQTHLELEGRDLDRIEALEAEASRIAGDMKIPLQHLSDQKVATRRTQWRAAMHFFTKFIDDRTAGPVNSALS
jgi:hypothetical protein